MVGVLDRCGKIMSEWDMGWVMFATEVWCGVEGLGRPGYSLLVVSSCDENSLGASYFVMLLQPHGCLGPDRRRSMEVDGELVGALV